MAGRGHQILPQPGAAQEPSAHQRPMATNSEVHSSIMTGGGNPNYGLRRRDTIIKIIITGNMITFKNYVLFKIRG